MQNIKEDYIVLNTSKTEFFLCIKQGNNDPNYEKIINSKKYMNIKYEGIKEMQDFVYKQYDVFSKNAKYHAIKFITNEGFDIYEIGIFIEKMFERNKNAKNYGEILKDVCEYFDNIHSSSSQEKIRDDIGEALFILKCIDLNIDIKQIIKKEKNEDNNFNFIFIDSQNTVEIKTTTKLKSKINLKLTQTLQEEKSNIIVIKVNVCEKTKIDNEYVNLLDIYDLIEKRNSYLPVFFEVKKKYYENNIELVNENYIEFDNVNYGFLKKEFIPYLDVNDIKNNEAINEIIFVLNVSQTIDDDLEYFNKKLISTTKNKMN